MQPFPHDTAATFWPKERLSSFAALVSTLLVLIKPEDCALVTFITQQVLKQAWPQCGDVNQLPQKMVSWRKAAVVYCPFSDITLDLGPEHGFDLLAGQTQENMWWFLIAGERAPDECPFADIE
jgi:hypothetical protein